MIANDRIVTVEEFMELLGCGITHFGKIQNDEAFPPDSGLYQRKRTWWASDVNKYIEHLKSKRSFKSRESEQFYAM